MSEFGYKIGTSATTFRRTSLAASIITALLMGACGGGGGGADSAAEPPQSNVPPDNGSQVQPPPAPVEPTPVSNAEAFLFQPGPSVASDEALDTIADGRRLFQSWNPAREQMLKPGMKVSFFGRAESCAADLVDGPVASSAMAPDAATLRKMALGVSGSGYVRDWQPSGANEQCSVDSHGAVGPSRVVLHAGTNGGVGLYTTAATSVHGAEPFLRTYGAGGQNGLGANAFNTSSFVTFRMDWRQSPRRPWGQPGSVARIFTRQSVGTTTVTAPAGATQPVQAKQFLSVAFINSACAAQGITAERPCALKYLFPLTIAQANVDDWDSVGWFNRGRVWFDPVQGNMPIVEGSPTASGTTLNDGASGLPLFTSAGEPAQHAAFSDQAFDMRISFGQLTNVLRIVSARQAGVSPAAVTDDQLIATWGTQWNTASQWALVTVAVGQEVHNPYPDGEASIGGAFSSVYVGPRQ